MFRIALPVLLVVVGGAAEGLLVAFDPRPTPPELSWRAAFDLRGYGEAAARDAAGELALDRERMAGSWLGVRGERDEVWFDAQAQRTAIIGDARLPSGADPTGEYLEVTGGGMWKRRLGEGDLVGASLRLGGDGQPDGLEAAGGATIFGRIGLGEVGSDGLLVALDVDADRVVFGNIPVLPLIAWQGMRGPWFLLLGVPFTSVTYRDKEWSTTAVIGPMPALSADVRLSGPLAATAEVRWNVLQVRRADRPHDEDRLRLSQWETAGGLRLGLGPQRVVELLGGIATARRLGEDEDGADARRSGLALEETGFVALRGRWMF